MNSLSSTFIYEVLNTRILPKFKEKLQPENFKNYIVDTSLYDYYIKIFKSYKYQLAKLVVNYFDSGKIKLVNFYEPINGNEKESFQLPPYFPPFIVIDKSKKTINKKDVTVYVNTSGRAKYIRNKIDNSIETFKLSERDAYAYLQSAATYYILFAYHDELLKNDKFIKLCAEAWTTMFVKCINKTYPIAAEKSDSVILNFLCNLYVLQVMFNCSVDKAISYAYSMKNVDKTVIETNCKTLDENLEMKNIFDLIKFIEDEFDYIRKGSINHRNITLEYTRMYGANSMLAIEYFYSFLNMIQTANLKLGMFNDILVEQQAGYYIKNIESILYSVTQSE